MSLNDVCMSMFRSCFCIGREKCWRKICVPSVVGLSCRELIFGCGEFGECISCMCMLGPDLFLCHPPAAARAKKQAAVLTDFPVLVQLWRASAGAMATLRPGSGGS